MENMVTWLASLREAERERVFAVMRKLDMEASDLRENLRIREAPFGTLSVGSADFDPLLRAVGIEGFLRGLRKGLNPTLAGELAKYEMAYAVQVHNGKRPKDVNWQRHLESGSANIPHLVGLVSRAATSLEV